MPGYTYITTNKNKTVLYIGATNDINRRIIEHKTKVYKTAFTARYNCDRLVYFETFATVNKAFARGKKLKAGSRKKKEELINKENPNWDDLASNWQDEDFDLTE